MLLGAAERQHGAVVLFEVGLDLLPVALRYPHDAFLSSPAPASPALISGTSTRSISAASGACLYSIAAIPAGSMGSTPSAPLANTTTSEADSSPPSSGVSSVAPVRCTTCGAKRCTPAFM